MAKRCRTFFSATVSLPAATATSMEQLMRDSLLDWGKNEDGSPSMDSFMGSEASVVPDAVIYVGSDANVRTANADPLYQGVEVGADENYSLQDPGMRGIIDPGTIWFFSTPGANIKLTFQGA